MVADWLPLNYAFNAEVGGGRSRVSSGRVRTLTRKDMAKTLDMGRMFNVRQEIGITKRIDMGVDIDVTCMWIVAAGLTSIAQSVSKAWEVNGLK